MKILFYQLLPRVLKDKKATSFFTFLLFAMSFCVEGINAESDKSAWSVGAGGDVEREKLYRTKTESQFGWHAHTLWENRYVTEGRDNLSGQSLLSVSSEFNFDQLMFIPWLADSAGAKYSELNLTVFYGFELEKGIELSAGINHIQSRQNSIASHDNEISLDVIFAQIYSFEMSAGIYHSFEVAGSFIELSAKHGLRIDYGLDASFKVVLGVNAGYIAGGHDGLNHLQLIANVDFHPVKRLELYAYAGYNMAIDRDVIKHAGDVSLDSFFWTGIGFIYRH